MPLGAARSSAAVVAVDRARTTRRRQRRARSLAMATRAREAVSPSWMSFRACDEGALVFHNSIVPGAFTREMIGGADASTAMYASLCVPRARARGLVVVVHTAIGAREAFVERCCDALASAGFDAVAPDLYDTGACVFDKDTQRAIRGGIERRAAFGARKVRETVRAFRRETKTTQPWCALGFCLGGQVVLDCARGLGADRDEDVLDDVRAVCSFHGVLDGVDLDGTAATSARVLMCHGASDPFVPPENVDACLNDLRQRGIENVQLISFDGVKHGFTRPEKVQQSDFDAGFGYDAEATLASWRACLDLLDDATT